MTADRELLQSAAKAAGIDVVWRRVLGFGGTPNEGFYAPDCRFWNPLTDDGDALRLAAALNIYLMIDPADKEVSARIVYGEPPFMVVVSFGNDKNAAVRRAIVQCAAAAIGEAK